VFVMANVSSPVSGIRVLKKRVHNGVCVDGGRALFRDAASRAD
jgi:hypothetical protein